MIPGTLKCDSMVTGATPYQTSVPILIIVPGSHRLLGAYLVTRAEPVLSKKTDFNEELKMLIDEDHGAAV